MADFKEMGKAALLSNSVKHLIDLYDDCRVAFIIIGVAALLVFPAAFALTAYAKRPSPGKSELLHTLSLSLIC